MHLAEQPANNGYLMSCSCGHQAHPVIRHTRGKAGQDIFEDDNGWVDGELPAHGRVCGSALSPVLGHRKWHPSLTLALPGAVWADGSLPGWGWVKGEEIQPLASSRMQCPERRLAWAPAWGQRLLLVWESERRVRVFLGAGSRSLLRWAAPLRAGKRGLAP